MGAEVEATFVPRVEEKGVRTYFVHPDSAKG
jgi:hypothetical protein